MEKKRILTGDNTTGHLHLGHYVGSLENRVKLQNDYETFIILADMHALAYPKYVSNTDVVSDSILQVTIDNLAVGLDPKKVTFFPESAIPEIYELGIIFSMIISHNTILRNPTIKDEIRDKNLGETYSMGFLNFPLLMAADILALSADLVPVGDDQSPHVELTRDIVHKFNGAYGEVLKEPKALIGRVARLIGTDGNAKMTKSLDNCIFLSDSESEIKRRVMNMYTDPKRIHPTDPGTIENNPVFIYHEAFNQNKEEVKDLQTRYKTGQVGDVEVKEKLFKVINELLKPVREKRTYYENHKDEVYDILKAGAQKTREEAKKVLFAVKEKMKLPNF